MSASAGLLVAAALAAGALAWIEWRRPGRLRAARMLAAAASVGCLLVIALHPSRARSVSSATATIATMGADSAGRGAAYAIGLTVPGAATAPDLGWVARLYPPPASVTVAGWGLDEEQWPEAADPHLPFAVAAELTPPPAGITSITWPSSLAMGEEAVVRGRVGAGPATIWVVMADASGPLDSARVSVEDLTFTLRARPRAAGHWHPTIRLVPGRGIPPESLAIEVRPSAPLRVILIESSPSFDTRFLRDWLAGQGATVVMRTTVSRGRVRITGVNAPARDEFSRAALDSVGVVVIRGSPGAVLAAAERRALDEAVRERGLGLVVLADSAPVSERFGAEVLMRDEAGVPIVEVTPTGSGRIARTSVVNSVAWKLRGDSGRYAAFWARVLGAVRRPPDLVITVEGSDPLFANRPALVVARGDTGMNEVTVEQAGGPVDTVYLASTPGDNTTHRGIFWPPRPGWYRLGGSAGTDFFAYDTSSWVARRAQRRTEATLARVGPGERPARYTIREPVPLWPAFLGFLLGAGVLWWAQMGTLSSGRTAHTGQPRPARQRRGRMSVR